MRKVLIVDDSREIRTLIAAVVMSKSGFSVAEAASCAGAESMIEAGRYDLIFLDHHLGDGIGWTLADKIAQHPGEHRHPVIVAMSGSVAIGSGRNGNISKYMPKPFDVQMIDQILIDLPPDEGNG